MQLSMQWVNEWVFVVCGLNFKATFFSAFIYTKAKNRRRRKTRRDCRQQPAAREIHIRILNGNRWLKIFIYSAYLAVVIHIHISVSNCKQGIILLYLAQGSDENHLKK